MQSCLYSNCTLIGKFLSFRRKASVLPLPLPREHWFLVSTGFRVGSPIIRPPSQHKGMDGWINSYKEGKGMHMQAKAYNTWNCKERRVLLEPSSFYLCIPPSVVTGPHASLRSPSLLSTSVVFNTGLPFSTSLCCSLTLVGGKNGSASDDITQKHKCFQTAYTLHLPPPFPR